MLRWQIEVGGDLGRHPGLVVGVAVGFRPDGSAFDYILAFLLLLLFSFAFSWIAATVGLAVGSVEAAQSGGFIWLFPLTFASSAFVPVDSMPGWLQAFAEHQPVTVTVDAIRAWTLGTPVGTAGWQALGWSSPLQADPTSAYGCVSAHQPKGPKRLLLQLDADEDRLDFDDTTGGQLMITITAADLRAGRFDRLCGEYLFD